MTMPILTRYPVTCLYHPYRCRLLPLTLSLFLSLSLSLFLFLSLSPLASPPPISFSLFLSLSLSLSHSHSLFLSVSLFFSLSLYALDWQGSTDEVQTTCLSADWQGSTDERLMCAARQMSWTSHAYLDITCLSAHKALSIFTRPVSRNDMSYCRCGVWGTGVGSGGRAAGRRGAGHSILPGRVCSYGAH